MSTLPRPRRRLCTVTTTLVTSLVVHLAALSAWVSAQCSRSGLNDGPLQVTKGAIDFDVEYDNGACGTGGDAIATALAQDCLDTLDTAYDLYVSYGFRTPYLSTLPDYNALIYDIPSGRGEAHSGCIRIDAPSFDCDTDDLGIRGTTLHEMFHTIQRHYMCAVRNCNSGGHHHDSVAAAAASASPMANSQPHFLSMVFLPRRSTTECGQ